MALRTYNEALKAMPLLTKGTTAGVLFGFGDTIAQTAEKRETHDMRRKASFIAFGATFFAPTQHYWFQWMEMSVARGAAWDARGLVAQSMARVTVHSLVYAPFSIASLFVWMDIFNGSGTLEEVTPAAIFPIWLAGGTFWIPTMFAIYRYVPLQARVVVTSIANVAWSTYLSIKRSAATTKP